MPACSDEQLKKNFADALALPDDYYTGIKVTIVAANKPAPGVIGLKAPGSDATHDATWGNLGQMWAPCPSPFQSEAVDKDHPGPPPKVDQGGELYLSKAYVDAETKAGRTIATNSVDPKWPRSLPSVAPAKPMLVAATSIIVSGVELMTGETLTLDAIEIMNPAFGSPRQSGIQFDEKTNAFVLWLTEAAFRKVGVPFDGFKDLSRAKAIIDGREGGADDMVWARRVVTAAERMYPEARREGRVTDADRDILAGLLDHSLPEL